MSARLAYVLSRYPKVSETFVRDEIEALQRRGVDLEICALLPGRDLEGGAPGPGDAYVVGPPSPRWIAAQLYWLLHAPRRLFGTWYGALRRHRGSLRQAGQALLAVGAASVLALRLRRRGIEHVHAHFATHAALAAWAIRRLGGIPYSFTAHADDIFVRRPMLAEKVGEAAFVVTISEFNRRFLLERIGEGAAARVRVVHCGIDTDTFAPVAPAPREAPFTIVCVGRLEEKKGQRHLLEACHRLKARGIRFRCLLVGAGRERTRLEQLRDALELEGHVELLGVQPRARIRELLAGAHVFALPSVVAPSGRAEGIPVALMEAMAMQRPVVSTRTSGIPELVEGGRSGWLVEPGNPEALAQALVRIHEDPAQSAAMAREARQVVRTRFDRDRNAGRLLGLFVESMRGAGAGLEEAAARIGCEAGPVRR